MDIPRMTKDQQDALCAPVSGMTQGLFVDEHGLEYVKIYNGKEWINYYIAIDTTGPGCTYIGYNAETSI